MHILKCHTGVGCMLGGKYFWFCTAHNPLNMEFSCRTNGNQFLNLASVAVPYLVTKAFPEQSGFNVTLVVGLSVVILQLCFQGNSVTVMVKLLTAY